MFYTQKSFPSLRHCLNIDRLLFQQICAEKTAELLFKLQVNFNDCCKLATLIALQNCGCFYTLIKHHIRTHTHWPPWHHLQAFLSHQGKQIMPGMYSLDMYIYLCARAYIHISVSMDPLWPVSGPL